MVKVLLKAVIEFFHFTLTGVMLLSQVLKSESLMVLVVRCRPH